MDAIIILGSRKEWTWLVCAQVLPHFAFTGVDGGKPPLTPTKNHKHKERRCVDDKKASVSGTADWNAGICAAVILLLGRQDGENLCSFFPWLNFSANNNMGFTTVVRISIFMVKGKFTDCVWLNVATFLLIPFMWKQETNLPYNDLHFQNSMYFKYLKT